MTLEPSPVPYRGLLRWMEGSPTWPELARMGALLLGALFFLKIARSMLRNYWRGRAHGLSDASGRVVVLAVGCLAAGGGLFWWLWLLLEGIAARMGLTILALVVLLAGEIRSGGRRGRR